MKQLLERKHSTRIIVLALLLTMLAWLVPMNIGEVNAAAGDTVKIEVTGGHLFFDKTTGTITGYEGEITEAAIPAEIEGVKVVTIGHGAFKNCQTLSSITIPEGVTAIGDNVFYGCNISSLTIPASVTSINHGAFGGSFSTIKKINVAAANPEYSSLDGVLFDKNKTKLIKYPAGREESNYVIPEGVTVIGRYAFQALSLNGSVTLPNSLTTIEPDAFTSSFNLMEIKIGEANLNFSTDGEALLNKDGTTLVYHYKALGYGYKPESYTIPESVTTIAESAISGVKVVEIPESVTSIGDDAITAKDEPVTIKGYTGSIAEYYAQDNEISFVSLGTAKNPLNRVTYAVDRGNLYFYKSTGTIVKADDEITGATIPETIEGVKVTSIAAGVFSDCRSLANVTIPSSVTEIGGKAFFGIWVLRKVTIPDSVTSIGEYAFGYDWDEDNNLTKVSDFKIYGYSNDSAAAKYAKDNGFDYAIVGTEPGGDDKPIGGTEGTNPSGNDNDNTGGDKPAGDSGQNNNGNDQVNPPSPPTKDEPATDPTTAKVGSTVQDKKSNGSYVVTRSQKNGGTVTYKKPVNKKKSSVTIPATVRIEGKTYKVTTVEKNAFKGNKNLKSVKIGSNIQTIGANAFNKCTKLKTVKLPSKVKTIQKGAFAGCKNLKTITIQTKKLTKKTVGAGAFKGVNSKATVKVPKGKAKTYQKLLRSKGLSKKAKVK